jgi:uncharacterized RDD family membrane protein YckC
VTTPAQTDPTAVFGRRVVAVIIDWLLISVPTLLLASASFEYVENPRAGFCDDYLDQVNGACIAVGDRAYFTDGVSPVSTLLGFALSIGLLVVLQGLTGFTPGKLITGIRTVRHDGSAPGIGRAALRWILLLVDSLPCIPLVGFITALTSTGHRRVGDMAAKTLVVRSKAMGSPVLVPGLTTAPGTMAYAGSAPGWGAPPGQTGAWAPPASPPTAPPTSPDPTQVGWGGPTPPAQDAAPPTESSPWAAPGASSPTAPPEPEPVDAAEPEPVDAAEPEPERAPTPEAEPAGAAPAAPEPQWDEARGTYIQWDPAQQRWLQWDDAAKTWVVIPGQ